MEREELVGEEDTGFVTMATVPPAFEFIFLLPVAFYFLISKFEEEKRRRNRTSFRFCFPADVPAYCIRVIDWCRVRPANRYVSASFVYIKSHLLRTDGQESKEKAGCHDCHNWKERPTHGPLQGRACPCRLAICQRKEKGTSRTDVSEICCLSCFYYYLKKKKIRVHESIKSRLKY